MTAPSMQSKQASSVTRCITCPALAQPMHPGSNASVFTAELFCYGVCTIPFHLQPPVTQADSSWRALLLLCLQAAHGSEPSFTWPSGIQAPLMDEGEPHCADYVYAWQAPGHQLLVTAAQLCGDVPSEQDATLYPSDHIGIKVKLRVVPSSSSSSGQGGDAATAAGEA
jgi:hypothetical protein